MFIHGSKIKDLFISLLRYDTITSQTKFDLGVKELNCIRE